MSISSYFKIASCVVVLVSTHLKCVQGLGDTLNECKYVASQFRQTCDPGTNYDIISNSVGAMPSDTFTCTNWNKNACPGTRDPQTGHCSWERKLCVTCRVNAADGITRIRVQTNNMPDHCVWSHTIAPHDFDYEVNFNSQYNSASDIVNAILTQDELNNAVCPIQKSYNGDVNIVEYGADVAKSSRSMGFAINGVAFQFANPLKEDPVFPINEDNEQPLDTCLGHNKHMNDGMYHYHELSPCINSTFLDNMGVNEECVDHTACNDDKVAWSLSGFEGMKSKTIIGISKDGLVLYGPYDGNGNLWEAEEVDACNGVYDSTTGDYFYVGTQWHPYVVGCQGPATKPHEDSGLYAQCSTNNLAQYHTYVGTPCIDSTTWFITTPSGTDLFCGFVAQEKETRCSKVGTDGSLTNVLASVACPVSCGTCPP